MSAENLAKRRCKVKAKWKICFAAEREYRLAGRLIAADRLREGGTGGSAWTLEEESVQAFAQFKTAAEEACAHGLRSESQLFGGFFGGKISNVAQQANTSQRRVQLRKSINESSAQFEARVELLGVFASGARLKRHASVLLLTHHFVQASPAVITAAAQQADGFVGGDLRDPGGAAIAVTDLVEVREGLEEGLLADVFRVMRIARDAQSNAINGGIARGSEGSKGVSIAE